MNWASFLERVALRVLDSLLGHFFSKDSSPQPEPSPPPSEPESDTIPSRLGPLGPFLADPAAIPSRIGPLAPIPHQSPTSTPAPPQPVPASSGLLNRKVFFDEVRDEFDRKLTKGQVEGIDAILDYWEEQHGSDMIERLAYILATAWHETGTEMKPVREGFAETNAGAIAAVTRLYKRGRISRNYAEPHPQTGQSYYGRGLVQITHIENYRKLGHVLGIDLVSHPDLALSLDVSVRCLVDGMYQGLYTGRKLGDYIRRGSVDYRGARRIINSLDKASTIAKYAARFESALEEARR